MSYACIDSLPGAPSGKTGWPWTEASRPVSAETCKGRPWPKISIVTPSYNQGRFLEETIRSVLLQGYPNLEYIVIDGGSTDESAEIIRKYEPWLTYWVSERDRGQSHAINKGLARCTGEIFNWINSDDVMDAGALQAVARAWLDAPGTVIAGNVADFNENGVHRIIVPTAVTLENFMNVHKARRCQSLWHQPGTFLPLASVQRAGGVREELRYTMDHFLMIELLCHCRVVCIPEQLAHFRLHSGSKTVTSSFPAFPLEKLATLRKMKDLHGCVTVKEIKTEQVSIFLTCAGMARRKGSYRESAAYIAKAIRTSPILVAQELLRRNSFQRALGRLLRLRLRTSSGVENHGNR
jgi:glycosyltransferase involved in cell wall biosynthesis